MNQRTELTMPFKTTAYGCASQEDYTGPEGIIRQFYQGFPFPVQGFITGNGERETGNETFTIADKVSFCEGLSFAEIGRSHVFKTW